MIKNLLCALFTALLFVALSDASLLFAETFQWTDEDGSLHFSDTLPTKSHSNKQPILLKDDKSFEDSGQQLSEPNAACLQEMRSLYDKNYENFEICSDSAESKLKQKISPECLKPYESKKFNYSEACRQEIKIIALALSIEIKQCVQDRFYSILSSKCREQKNRYQKSKAACAEISKKIESICAAKLECYEEHQAEREAVCSGLSKQ